MSACLVALVWLVAACNGESGANTAGPNAANAGQADATEGDGANAARPELPESAWQVPLNGATAGAVVVSMADVLRDPGQPLPLAAKAAFEGIRSDPDPASLVRNAHYWVSNEYSHYIFKPYIDGVGGSFVGVGTDQVYLLAGWARSSVVIPLDFDRAVTRLHHVYGLLFEHAATFEEFRDLWDDPREEYVLGLIEQKWGDDPAELKKMKRSYTSARDDAERRFRITAKTYEKLGIPTFLTDQTEYDVIRKLWLNDRVYPVCGDLTADQAMLDVAVALENTKQDLRLLYVSNAEVYFPFEAGYRRNIISMPWSDASLVLRTRQVGYLGLAREGDYHYNIQSGISWSTYLAYNRGMKKISDLFYYRTETDTLGLSFIDRPPTVNARPPIVAARPDGKPVELPPRPSVDAIATAD